MAYRELIDRPGHGGSGEVLARSGARSLACKAEVLLVRAYGRAYSGSIVTRGGEVRVTRPLPRVLCAPDLIGEVFHNLLANASKYTDKDDKWVEIEACEEPDFESDEFATICVRDNGIGMDPSQGVRAFQMFRRLHRGDDFGGGTGVGLTIAKRIVELQHGRIWFESTPGRGTIFYFTLKLASNGAEAGPIQSLT